MKVKDLIEEIKQCQKEYGEDFLGWDVYAEQLYGSDKKSKRRNSQWKWEYDSEGREYIECAGFWTKVPAKKVFTINVNY